MSSKILNTSYQNVLSTKCCRFILASTAGESEAMLSGLATLGLFLGLTSGTCAILPTCKYCTANILKYVFFNESKPQRKNIVK